MIVNVDKDIPVVPNWIQGRHVMFLAQGTVEGAVDFTNLDEDAVEVDRKSKSVKIRLPHAELKAVQWDVEASHVLEHSQDADRPLQLRRVRHSADRLAGQPPLTRAQPPA